MLCSGWWTVDKGIFGNSLTSSSVLLPLKATCSPFLLLLVHLLLSFAHTLPAPRWRVATLLSGSQDAHGGTSTSIVEPLSPPACERCRIRAGRLRPRCRSLEEKELREAGRPGGGDGWRAAGEAAGPGRGGVAHDWSCARRSLEEKELGRQAGQAVGTAGGRL
jgi:hypothetical protein